MRPSLLSLMFLSPIQVDLGNIALASLSAGYVMALIGLWIGRVPGFVPIDLADYGRRYMVSDRPSAWIVGLASHLANSFLLTLAFACLVRPNLHWPGWLAGLAWGEFLSLSLGGMLLAPLTGAGFLGIRTRNLRFATSSIVMHAAWGLLIGVLYSASPR